MSELKTVALASIRPSPFRDLVQFPLIPKKVEALRDSIKIAGFWEGVIVRPAKGGGYEQAFGHHRVAAAVEALGKDARVPVIVRELTDDQMLHFMNQENAEEHGWDFYNTTVQAVRAVVLAFAKGEIELGDPKKAGHGAEQANLRYAPSFTIRSGEPNGFPYNAFTLARYLGWTTGSNKSEGWEPTKRVLVALAALELIEQGGLTPRAITGLTQEEAGEVVRKARDAAKVAKQEAEEREAELLRKHAAAERQKQLDAERAEREYAARVKREGEEKARKEREALEAAKRKLAAEQAAKKKAEAEAKERVDRAVREARAKSTKDTIERLRTDSTASDLRQERKIEQRSAPNAKPLVAIDLTPRGSRAASQLAGITLPADLQGLLDLAYDPTHVFPNAVARKIDAELKRIGAAVAERRADLKAVARKRGWSW